MKKYLALIMKSEDFGWGLEEGESVEDILIDGFLEKESWVTGYTFSCPDKLPEDLVVKIGHGIFWENGWTLDDTVSCMVEDFGEEAPELEEEPDEEDSDPEDENVLIIKATVS